MLNLTNKIDRSHLITLQHTKKILKNELHPEWKELQIDYADCEADDTVSRVILSIANSILFQKRIIFILTRRSVQKLVKGDKNHVFKQGFNNTNWSYILSQCYNILFKKRGEKNGVNYYELFNKKLLNFLTVDIKKQLCETIDFIGQDQPQDHSEDQPQDHSEDQPQDRESKKARKQEIKNFGKQEIKNFGKQEIKNFGKQENKNTEPCLTSSFTSFTGSYGFQKQNPHIKNKIFEKIVNKTADELEAEFEKTFSRQ